MKFNTGDWIKSKDDKKVTIMAEGFPCEPLNLALGLLMIGGGIYSIIRGSFKSGAKAYGRGELHTLDVLGYLEKIADETVVNTDGAERFTH